MGSWHALKAARTKGVLPPALPGGYARRVQNVVERILNLLAFLLTSPRPVTAEEIRDTIAGYDQAGDEAFRRMFERDKDLLRGLGIPIQRKPTDAWAVEYGYVIPPEEYELPDPGLTDEELAALWLAAQAVRLGGQVPGPGALFKLGGAPLAAAGEPLAADLGPGADVLADAFVAVAERRRLSFTYRDRKRRLEPYGLVHRNGHWYLVGHDRDADEVRAYRIDRAADLKAGSNADVFRRPRDFNVASALAVAPWEAGTDPEITAVVRFDAAVAWWARRQLGRARISAEESDGSLTVEFDVANPDSFIGWLLAFGADAELMNPPELRMRLVERVRAAG